MINGPRISEFYNKLRFLPIIGHENSSGFELRRVVFAVNANKKWPKNSEFYNNLRFLPITRPGIFRGAGIWRVVFAVNALKNDPGKLRRSEIQHRGKFWPL